MTPATECTPVQANATCGQRDLKAAHIAAPAGQYLVRVQCTWHNLHFWRRALIDHLEFIVLCSAIHARYIRRVTIETKHSNIFLFHSVHK